MAVGEVSLRLCDAKGTVRWPRDVTGKAGDGEGRRNSPELGGKVVPTTKKQNCGVECDPLVFAMSMAVSDAAEEAWMRWILLGELGGNGNGVRFFNDLGRMGDGALQGCFIGEGRLPLRGRGRMGRGVPAKADSVRGSCGSELAGAGVGAEKKTLTRGPRLSARERGRLVGSLRCAGLGRNR